jgi:peroxiredoxin
MRIALRILLTLVAVYAVLVAGLAFAMRQPPDKFGAIMAKMPMVAFIALPFEPLWMNARAGHLQVGDAAPDFALKTPDGAAEVQLSSFRGQKPVVLVFGSYT